MTEHTRYVEVQRWRVLRHGCPQCGDRLSATLDAGGRLTITCGAPACAPLALELEPEDGPEAAQGRAGRDFCAPATTETGGSAAALLAALIADAAAAADAAARRRDVARQAGAAMLADALDRSRWAEAEASAALASEGSG